MDRPSPGHALSAGLQDARTDTGHSVAPAVQGAVIIDPLCQGYSPLGRGNERIMKKGRL